jgi:hypothetical protein
LSCVVRSSGAVAAGASPNTGLILGKKHGRQPMASSPGNLVAPTARRSRRWSASTGGCSCPGPTNGGCRRSCPGRRDGAPDNREFPAQERAAKVRLAHIAEIGCALSSGHAFFFLGRTVSLVNYSLGREIPCKKCLLPGGIFFCERVILPDAERLFRTNLSDRLLIFSPAQSALSMERRRLGRFRPRFPPVCPSADTNFPRARNQCAASRLTLAPPRPAGHAFAKVPRKRAGSFSLLARRV